MFYLFHLTSRQTSGLSLKDSFSLLNSHRLRKIVSNSLLTSVPFRVPSLPHSQRLSVASFLLVHWFNSSLLNSPQLFCKMSASLQPSSLAHFQHFVEICQPKAALSLLAHCSEMWSLSVFRQLGFTISCFKITSVSTSNSILQKVVWGCPPHPSTNNHTKKFLCFFLSQSLPLCLQIPSH